VAKYSLAARKRLQVKPGLTCLWQIQGRSDIPFDRLVSLDMQYIRSQSLLKDIIIIIKTIPAVLFGRGAY
jgi:lipopolysaccharide/colanic/teichoic acid biosynthesis glycosyltransferase